MAKHTFNLSVYAECPRCGEENISFLYVTEISLFKDGNLEMQGITEYETAPPELNNTSASLYKGADYLLEGYCAKCKDKFSIALDCPQYLQDIVIPAKVQFSKLGLPELIQIGKATFKVINIENIKCLYGYHNDQLFSKPPFGEYLLKLDIGLCVVIVEPYVTNLFSAAQKAEGDWFQVRITKANSFAKAKLVEAEKQGLRELGETASTMESLEQIEKEIIDPRFKLPSQFLSFAAFEVIYLTEIKIRNTVWNSLEEKYKHNGSNWWKGVLSLNIKDRICDRAKRRGDPAFKKNPPRDYLTIGEVRELLSDKWEREFGKLFMRREAILSKLVEYEDCRNDVAHARPITFAEYSNLIACINGLVEMLKIDM